MKIRKLAAPLIVTGVTVLTLALAACKPEPAHEPFIGSTVDPRPSPTVAHDDPAPLLVAMCEAVNDQGPCVDGIGDSGMWVLVGTGGTYPVGTVIDECPTEDGGPTLPCVWLGQHAGYVFGLESL